MNKNLENYKKSVNNIYASEEIKKKTLDNMKKNKKVSYIKFLATCAMFFIVFSSGIFFYKSDLIKEKNMKDNYISKNNIIKNEDEDMPRFKDIEHLKSVLAKESKYRSIDKFDMAVTESVNDLADNTKGDYSTTNKQVENVDEADIVKTDGKYIYYVSENYIYIVDKDLNLKSKIDFKKDENEYFNVQEIFLKDSKLVLLGNYFKNEVKQESSMLRDYSYIHSEVMAQAVVYDVKDRENPKEGRKVLLDGYYKDSRMIGDNVYFISNKNIYYFDEIKETEILPRFMDSAITDDIKYIQAEDIAYFRNSNNHSYMMCSGFNINNEENSFTETIYGASDIVYASENNLYTCYTEYNYSLGIEKNTTTIFKFKLEDSFIKLKAKAKINGQLNNQFSMDEYEDNLRIATTTYNNIINEDINKLYILDENLEKIGEISGYAKGERIYSVRFVGNIGYVVTFEQIDPLFVMDLSDPTNPQIKGELKIPGYSSYLHPYDENHIIGIGYNTKSNGHGGVTNANMKMSMFDVSNLEDPKELFSIDIGNNYAYSDITYNHKCLFYNKKNNLIGFPVTYRENNSRGDKNAFTIFSIDLNNGFEKYGEISQKIDYRTNIDRAIYIGDNLYTLSKTKIVKYDLNTIEELKSIVFEERSYDVTDDVVIQ